MARDRKRRDKSREDIIRDKLRNMKNENSMFVVCQCAEANALLRVAKGTDTLWFRLRQNINPRDPEQRRARLDVFEKAHSEVLSYLREKVGELKADKGRIQLKYEEYTPERKEQLCRSDWCFVLLPRTPEARELYKYIDDIDRHIGAYKMHASAEVVDKASQIGMDALKVLTEYTKILSRVANRDYKPPAMVLDILGERQPRTEANKEEQAGSVDAASVGEPAGQDKGNGDGTEASEKTDQSAQEGNIVEMPVSTKRSGRKAAAEK